MPLLGSKVNFDTENDVWWRGRKEPLAMVHDYPSSVLEKTNAFISKCPLDLIVVPCRYETEMHHDDITFSKIDAVQLIN